MVRQQESRRDDPSSKKWVTIKEWSGGSGRKETEKFSTTTPNWRISWKTTTGDPDPIGTISIVVRNAANELVTLANNLGQKVATGSFNVAAKPGEYYLEIESADRSWQVSAEHAQ